MSERACGCALARLGWSRQLHSIRSFEKLTTAGMTVLDTDVVRILEDLLPARFGGAAADYQLVEDRVAPHGSSLRLLVYPRLGPVEPAAVTRLFLDALGASSPSAKRTPGRTGAGHGVARL